MSELKSASPLPQSPASLPSHRVPEAADYELKKQYLGLLPSEQIIEICLKLDMFAVSYIRSTIWPIDLNTAIESLRKTSPQASSSDAPPQSSVNSQPRSNDMKPPDKSPEMAHPGPGPSTAQTYQRQGYPYSSSQPYPHTPYYTGTAGFSFSSYQNHVGFGAPATAVQHQDYNTQAGQTPDDLPSYEEMIAQALQSMPTPEGVAPRDLFTWIAAHYPVQANFRPSASQALQKAFKRGRFGKTPAGKYQLNSGWEGPISSKRTTRRPQTVPQAQFHRLPVPAQPPQNVLTPPTLGGKSLLPSSATPNLDAYQAAHNILTALNSGDLVSLPGDDEKKHAQEAQSHTVGSSSTYTTNVSGSHPKTTTEVVGRAERPIAESRLQLQTQFALLATQLIECARENTTPPVGNSATDDAREEGDDDTDMERAA